MSAYREVKAYGLKSVKHTAALLDLTPVTIFRAYRNDQELFWKYVKRAYEIKYLEQKDDKS